MKRIFLFIFMLIVLLFVSMEAAIPAEKRAALIALYNGTNGDNWTDNSGWKDGTPEPDGFGPIGSEGTWKGITVENDHVTGIEFFGNNLSGPIPAELGSLSNLEVLYLQNNQLGGSIPPELGNLSNLEWLALYNNQLGGTIPPELGSLSKLTWLELSGNQLSGSIPPELGNLTSLFVLSLSSNQLSGSIPPELGNLSNIEHLSLSSNQLGGTIPPELGNLSRLDTLDLSSNQLGGSIPPELKSLSNLMQLFLSSNRLSGNIPPEMGELPALETLDLSSNRLSGSIPPELGNHGNLFYLYLSSNQLTGAVPVELNTLVWLYRIDFRWNGLYTDDDSLRAFLNSKQEGGDWESTQTIAPANVSAATLSSSSVRVSWAPIVYTGDTGGYEVYYSTTSGGTWTYAGITADKSTASYDVTGLNVGTTYYFVIKTRTDSHSNNSNTVVSETSEEVSAVLSALVLTLNRAKMDFGYVIGGNVPGSQTLTISGGSAALIWAASVDVLWLNVSPSWGTGSAMVNVSINPTGLAAGTYTGTITVSSPNGANSPQTVRVILTVYQSGGSSEPFGEFATPLQGVTVRGSIPVTGWALDDTGVESVKIYREHEGNLVYIGDAVFVEGARPDVEQAFPDYPMNYRAGWGYMMLTNFLPGEGNGTFILHAIAADTEGNRVTLGTKTIICDNANAVKPFGAIDTPAQGGTASGSDYRNHGWVLTPPPNAVPTDGSTIDVYIDGVYMGHANYNFYRSDIAGLFPGYANSSGAHAYFDFDTTAYENGVHSIYWTAADDAGNTDGIGSRYFLIQNSQGARSVERGAWSMGHGAMSMEKRVACLQPVGIIKGYVRGMEPQTVYPDDNGMINIEINQLERLEIQLGDLNSSSFIIHRNDASFYSGFQLVGDQFRPLPIGSTFDRERGIFYWQAGPAFIGDYWFVFVVKGPNGAMTRWDIRVTIHPEFQNWRGRGTPRSGRCGRGQAKAPS